MGPWMRVPSRLGQLHGDHVASEDEAWLWLLSRWNVGADPGVREVRARTKWGASRAMALLDNAAAWAEEHGAAHVRRTKPIEKCPGTQTKTGTRDEPTTYIISESQNKALENEAGTQTKTGHLTRAFSSGEQNKPDEIRSDETERAAPAVAGCSPIDNPEGPRMPAWVPDAKATAPHDRRDVAAMVVRCIEAVRGKMPNPDRCGTDAAPLLSLWRKLGKPPPEAFAAEFRTVVEWAALSRDPGAARDIRAEGWDTGKDRHADIATLCRQDRWGDRTTAAQAWEEAGRAEARPVAQAAPVPTLTPSQARSRATRDALNHALNNIDNQTTEKRHALT